MSFPLHLGITPPDPLKQKAILESQWCERHNDNAMKCHHGMRATIASVSRERIQSKTQTTGGRSSASLNLCLPKQCWLRLQVVCVLPGRDRQSLDVE